MICRVNEDQLIAYMFDELSLDEQLNTSKHVAGCTKCQETLEQLQILQNAWENPNQFPIPEALTDNIMGMLDGKPEYQSNSKRDFFHQYKFKTITNVLVASAATIALLYAGVFSELPNVFASLTSLFVDTTNSLHLLTVKSSTWLYNMDFPFSSYVKPFNF